MSHNSYLEWEDEVTELIGLHYECPRGDAQGIVEAHDHILMECYSKDYTPELTAKAIVNA